MIFGFLLAATVLGAISTPVVFALHRRAWLAALFALFGGVTVQALYVGLLQSNTFGLGENAASALFGIPALAVLTCILLMFVIDHYAKPRPGSERPSDE